MHTISSRINLYISERMPYISVLLKGIGQIMLQENSITGLLFLIGISIGSYTMAIATVVSVVSGNLIAVLLKYDRKEIDAGLYGFSAALVGVALTLFYEPQVLVWVIIIIGSMLAAMLQHYFIVKKIPAFTFPFVLVTWGILYLINNLYPIAPSHLLNNNEAITEGYTFAFRGIGQVIFQEKLIVGVIFFVGIMINSPIASIYALVGSILSGVIALTLSMPTDLVFYGLFSYNAVLCAIVFANKNTTGVVWSIVSVILSLVIAIGMFVSGLTQLTFPFVAATVITMVIKKKTSRKVSIS